MVKNNDFPGIVFVSFESLNFLKKLINQHNKILQDSDKDNDLKKMFKYQICFDEGDYYKNMVYKKLQINDKFLFETIRKLLVILANYEELHTIELLHLLCKKCRELKIYYYESSLWHYVI